MIPVSLLQALNSHHGLRWLRQHGYQHDRSSDALPGLCHATPWKLCPTRERITRTSSPPRRTPISLVIPTSVSRHGARSRSFRFSWTLVIRRWCLGRRRGRSL
jgi:hypothetical protein